jgi:hypothetical protein
MSPSDFHFRQQSALLSSAPALQLYPSPEWLSQVPSLLFKVRAARLYPGKSELWSQSSFQPPVLASHPLSSLATFIFCVSRLQTPVRFRCGSHLRSPEASNFRLPRRPLGPLHCLMTSYMVNSFQLTRAPRLAWRFQRRKGAKVRRSREVLGSVGPALSWG